MITWNNFDWFALLSIALWGSGAAFALFSKERNRWAILLTLMGTLVFAVFYCRILDLLAASSLTHHG